jgi:hypothetical protein
MLKVWHSDPVTMAMSHTTQDNTPVYQFIYYSLTQIYPFPIQQDCENLEDFV